MTPAIAALVLGGILIVAGFQGRNVIDVALGRDGQIPDSNVDDSGGGSDAVAAPTDQEGSGMKDAPSGGKAGSPVAHGTSVGGLHATLGLPGYPAHDYFAPSGSEAVAPVGGKITRLSGHDPKMGPILGPHGPLGWSIYLHGTDGHTYFLTHLGSLSVHAGQTVTAGQKIGTVADYARYGTASHIHMGVH